jgi:hypothetical protein
MLSVKRIEEVRGGKWERETKTLDINELCGLVKPGSLTSTSHAFIMKGSEGRRETYKTVQEIKKPFFVENLLRLLTYSLLCFRFFPFQSYMEADDNDNGNNSQRRE